MKTYLLDIFPKIQNYSQKLDDLTLLTNQHWVLMDSVGAEKTIYIFRKNNELLVSLNGKVTKGKWEYLGNNSILIDIFEKSYLFKHGFFDMDVLALKCDNKNNYSVFINENQFEGELNSIDKLTEYLENKYVKFNLLEAKNLNIQVASHSVSNKKKRNEHKITNRNFRSIGYLLIFGSIFVGLIYSIKNIEKIKFHIFSDTSMCVPFCGPNITQAGTKGDLFLISLVTLIGIGMVIKNKSD